eukprot:scaffold7101_cov153-Amphora_coffeaeformis.AAC.4
MPPALRPPQLPPRSPRYPIKVEDLEAPASPPLPNDAVPKDGDDFVSGLSEDFVADDHLTSKHRQHSAEAQHKHLETPSLGTNGSANKLNLFWRGNSSKVASTDVASVGNASDTPIPQGAGTLTGRALHEHAKVALNREEYGTALQSFEALLEAQIQRFGPCHASVAAAMHNVVQELFAAQATFQEALNLYRDFWQEESPSMKSADRNALMMQLTDTLCNIGTIQNRRKRFTSAISSFQEALDLQRGVLPHDHPRILSTLDNLAYAYSKNKEYARAVTCYKNMLKAQVSHSRTFTPDCLETIHKRLLMYEKLKLPNQAVEDLKEIILWQKTMLPRDGPIVLETKKLLEQKRSARR